MNEQRRRLIAALAGVLAASLPGFAQERQRTYRIGVLSSADPAMAGHLINAFMQALQEAGYIEGQNLSVERRFAEGKVERLPALAADLVRRRVDLILAAGSVAVRPAKDATATIPIVFANVHDPVGVGLVADLARPGGNMTGTSSMAPDISAKRLELLKQAFPGITRIAVIVAADEFSAVQLRELQRAAPGLHMQPTAVEVRSDDDLPGVISGLRAWRADSLFVVQSPINFYRRNLLGELTNRMRLPSISSGREFVEAGQILSYGADLEHLYRRTAAYADKILKGAKPANLPIEQPSKFQMIVNLRRAKALGLMISPGTLVQADHVIE